MLKEQKNIHDNKKKEKRETKQEIKRNLMKKIILLKKSLNYYLDFRMLSHSCSYSSLDN
jgi:hypothetical protein